MDGASLPDDEAEDIDTDDPDINLLEEALKKAKMYDPKKQQLVFNLDGFAGKEEVRIEDEEDLRKEIGVL
ncbi:hypothetical protein H2201_002202 [Coniosporium apollinis]|uniref:Uncharacterized protein n=1 Tax=Coniosporium apollinis TaxID=61459 RepID=A0ABQ9NZ76_9PEZI|nr:hypothetical protein H2201_002202 [Coniosporium apollinis]